MLSRTWVLAIRCLSVHLVGTALLSSGCGGKSGESESNAQGGSGASSGGHAFGAASSSGGNATSGGTVTDGGAAAGAGASPASGGASPASGGSAPTLDCAKVTCPAIPNSCKQIVQDPNECCPTCTDSGCGECPLIKCAAGTHSETAPGDCCPSCIADPPDPCLQGQKSYAELRAQMLEKYGSTGCKNSSDCTLVLEDTACGFVCNTPLPSTLATSFVSNLENLAGNYCGACSAPTRAECVPLFPACVNGKCVGVPPR